jgi:hypothetical protein
MKAVTALALVTIVTVVTERREGKREKRKEERGKEVTLLPIEREGGYLHTAVIPTIGKFAQGSSR